MTDKTKMSPIWSSSLRDCDNKTELYLADKIVSMSNKSINFEGLLPCNHEEADSRIFTHADHAAKQSTKSVLIKACDTDILFIAVVSLCESSECWLRNALSRIRPGTVQWMVLNSQLGEVACSSFMPAFTGCDMVSAFRGGGKTTAWQT